MSQRANYSCSQCSFVAKFESALTMHRQLYHEIPSKSDDGEYLKATKAFDSRPQSAVDKKLCIERKTSKTPSNIASTTRFFNRLYTKFGKNRLFGHNESDSNGQTDNETILVFNNDPKAKKIKEETIVLTSHQDDHTTEGLKKEFYGCHLCPFIADRITVLDRHLLNDHEIGLDNLLKLVMAKTKETLSDDSKDGAIRTPYYQLPNEIIQEGDLVIENVTPKIRILKHAAVNTDLKFTDTPELDDNCRFLKSELETIIKKSESPEDELISKMKVLNDYMCKFIDSSNTLKKVLNKEYSKSRQNFKDKGLEESHYEFAIGDPNPRKLEHTQSEKCSRGRRHHSYERRDDDRNNSIY